MREEDVREMCTIGDAAFANPLTNHSLSDINVIKGRHARVEDHHLILDYITVKDTDSFLVLRTVDDIADVRIGEHSSTPH